MMLTIMFVGVSTALMNMPVVYADGGTKVEKNVNLDYIKCGSNYIPEPLPPVTRAVTLLLQIALPLVIILVGSLDFVKAVIASDQEKIKKNQNQFLNRLKAGLIFFFVITGFKFVVSLVANPADSDKFISCVDCMISDSASCGEITKNNPYLDEE